jgi:hypothetical protein
MSVRVTCFDEFRKAIAALGLPLTDDELRTVWPMVQDLYEQADSVRTSLKNLQGPDAVTAHVDHPDGVPHE